MHCPRCGHHETRVIDSRLARNGSCVRRRRQCLRCDARFTTTEERLRDNLFVLKNDGRREAFDRSKIEAGLQKACEKRPVDLEQIHMLIADVEASLENDFDNEVPARELGERVMQRLKRVDPIAYVRFASVYKDIRNLDELIQEIARLREEHED